MLTPQNVTFVSHEKWTRRYQRNNKESGRKNLRCFPYCCDDGHKLHGFCGNSVTIRVRNTDPGVTFFAELTLEGDGKRTTISAAEEAKCDQDGSSWFCGQVMEGEESKIIFNSKRGWHYGWTASKYTMNVHHVLRVYACTPQRASDGWSVVGTIDSPSFTMFCRRRARAGVEDLPPQFMSPEHLALRPSEFAHEGTSPVKPKPKASNKSSSARVVSSSSKRRRRRNTTDDDDDDDDDDEAYSSSTEEPPRRTTTRTTAAAATSASAAEHLHPPLSSNLSSTSSPFIKPTVRGTSKRNSSSGVTDSSFSAKHGPTTTSTPPSQLAPAQERDLGVVLAGIVNRVRGPDDINNQMVDFDFMQTSNIATLLDDEDFTLLDLLDDGLSGQELLESERLDGILERAAKYLLDVDIQESTPQGFYSELLHRMNNFFLQTEGVSLADVAEKVRVVFQIGADKDSPLLIAPPHSELSRSISLQRNKSRSSPVAMASDTCVMVTRGGINDLTGNWRRSQETLNELEKMRTAVGLSWVERKLLKQMEEEFTITMDYDSNKIKFFYPRRTFGSERERVYRLNDLETKSGGIGPLSKPEAAFVRMWATPEGVWFVHYLNYRHRVVRLTSRSIDGTRLDSRVRLQRKLESGNASAGGGGPSSVNGAGGETEQWQDEMDFTACAVQNDTFFDG